MMKDHSFLDSATVVRGTVLIVLNQKLNPDLFLRMKAISEILICADGGYNHLHSLFGDLHPPDHVIGDLDSID